VTVACLIVKMHVFAASCRQRALLSVVQAGLQGQVDCFTEYFRRWQMFELAEPRAGGLGSTTPTFENMVS